MNFAESLFQRQQAALTMLLLGWNPSDINADADASNALPELQRDADAWSGGTVNHSLQNPSLRQRELLPERSAGTAAYQFSDALAAAFDAENFDSALLGSRRPAAGWNLSARNPGAASFAGIAPPVPVRWDASPVADVLRRSADAASNTAAAGLSQSAPVQDSASAADAPSSVADARALRLRQISGETDVSHDALPFGKESTVSLRHDGYGAPLRMRESRPGSAEHSAADTLSFESPSHDSQPALVHDRLPAPRDASVGSDSAQRLSRVFQRDARRYDGGFSLF